MLTLSSGPEVNTFIVGFVSSLLPLPFAPFTFSIAPLYPFPFIILSIYPSLHSLFPFSSLSIPLFLPFPLLAPPPRSLPPPLLPSLLFPARPLPLRF